MADDNHRESPRVLFLFGHQEAKPAAAQLIPGRRIRLG
jgi:hypothetical protein